MQNQPLVLKSSNYLLAYLMIVHGLSALILLVLTYQVFIFILFTAPLLACCGVSLYRCVTMHASRTHPLAIVALLWSPAQQAWQLHNRQGQVIWAKLMPNRLISAYLLLLHFESQGNKRPIVLVVSIDALTAEVWRQLQVHVRVLKFERINK